MIYELEKKKSKSAVVDIVDKVLRFIAWHIYF